MFAGYIGSLYAIPMIPAWLSTLKKPEFMPPDPVLDYIGMAVYVLLGFALYFIWQADLNKKDTKICFYLMIFSLILSVLSIYIFFGLRSPFMALISLIMFIGIMVSTIFQSIRVSILACLCIVPCLIVGIITAYASYLIFVMNPDLPIFAF
jgi:tryptophan-rich sensory protein